MSVLSIATFFIFFVVLVVIFWKTFNYFNMTVFDALSMTGFGYHLKKLGFSLVLPFFIALFGTAMIFSDDDTSSKNSVSTNQRLEKKQTQQVQKQVSSEPTQITYTKEQVLEMENKVDYHGDDPMIRNRLGLPPKPASQY